MNAILIKLFATALALSQVTTRPDAVKTHSIRSPTRPRSSQILRDGCAHMRKAFDIEDINLDDLIATAMDDPQAVAGEHQGPARASTSATCTSPIKQFCKNETVDAVARRSRRGDRVLQQGRGRPARPHAGSRAAGCRASSLVLDGNGERFAELFEPDNRRLWVPLADIPEHVQKAFVAAEDKRFFQHKGIDERGVIRAFIGNLGEPGRPQGGSTITQQVAKNLLVGDDVTYERKIREMIVASRLERTLTKPEILEIYLNSIYLGRASWGIEMAARSYFGKPAKDLTLAEGALLAGLPRAELLQPRPLPRARAGAPRLCAEPHEGGRRHHGRRRCKRALAAKPRSPPSSGRGATPGFHFVDHLIREAKTFAGVDGLTARFLRRCARPSTPPLQRATETALQEGLARYELNDRPHAVSRAPRPISARRSASSRRRPRPQRRRAAKPRGSRRSSARGCRSTTCIGRRRSWSRRRRRKRRRGHPRRPRRRPHRAAHAWSAAIRRALKPARRRPRPRRRGSAPRARARRRTRARRAAHPPDRAGRGAGAGEQDRAHPRHGRRLLLSAEPAQPRHAGAPPAGLVAQAADLSRRARTRGCSPTRWSGTRR